MKKLSTTLFALCIFIVGCTSNITMENAVTIAKQNFSENSAYLSSHFTVQTNEVYAVTEKGEHIPSYKVIFLDEDVVPIAQYSISRKDGEIIQHITR
ncbi:hypothetical protein J2T13_003486 [Paenibacillus sp. DS2015]|uniref:hypothetical protein n=1 Tax=Paenibacillus sp. DS2015 TaxID=3373917 RepID=UPI003D1F2AAA